MNARIPHLLSVTLELYEYSNLFKNVNADVCFGDQDRGKMVMVINGQQSSKV